MQRIDLAVKEIKRIAKDNKYGYGQLNRYGPDYAEVQKKVNKYLRG